MNYSKINTIQNQKIPYYIKYVKFFLGFANFYQRFILSYSKIAANLTTFIKTAKKSFMFL